MKIKRLRAGRSSPVAISASRVLLVAAVAATGLLVGATGSQAQGLQGTSEKAAKPLVLAARQNPAQTKPENVKPGNEGLSYCNQMEAKPLGLRSPGGKNLVQFDKCY